MASKLLSLCVCLSIAIFSFAQQDPGPGTVTVFSEDGAKFTLFINGERKNANPDSRVTADMSEVPFSFRIAFEDTSLGEIDKRGIRQGKHCIYPIIKGKKGYTLKVGGCSESASTDVASTASTPATSASSTPSQLTATYNDGVISINDGRKLKVTKVKASGMTYPKVNFTALQGAKVSLKYDNANEYYEGESPIQYEIKNFENNNAYVTVTVDEGGPEKTWHVKLLNANGYDLKVED
jgi:hypothetical protein